MGKNLIPLLARALIAGLFLSSGLQQFVNPGATQQTMASHGIPLIPLFYAGAVALQIVGGLALLLGWWSRWGSAALIAFLIPTTVLFHLDFAQQEQVFNFTKNVAVIGGLLMLIRYGPGRLSVDGWMAARRAAPTTRLTQGERGAATLHGGGTVDHDRAS
jgi:putative oxidoreductase